MVSIESFIELVKKRDIGRLKFAIREANFDIDSQDEVKHLPYLLKIMLGGSLYYYMFYYLYRPYYNFRIYPHTSEGL